MGRMAVVSQVSGHSGSWLEALSRGAEPLGFARRYARMTGTM